MANFGFESNIELIENFSKMAENEGNMFGEMTRAGAEVVYKQALSNMKRVFKSTDRLEKNLKITKTYKSSSDDSVNTKVGIYGYLEGTEGKKISYFKKTSTSKKNSNKTIGGKHYSYNNGIPAPLVALAREFGSSAGEAKKPFLRPAFRQTKAIEDAMLSAQNKYIKGD